MTVEIRKATKKDINKIVEMLNSESTLIDDDSLYYREADVIQYITKPARTYVCTENGKIIGLLTAIFWEISKVISAEHIVIKQKFREKGIGISLINFLEKIARKENYELIEFYSEFNNKIIHKLAEKKGYKKGKQTYYFSKNLEEKR